MTSLLPHPDDAVVCWGPTVRTAADLRAHVGAVVAALAGTDGPVTVACTGRYALTVALLGTWASGRVARVPAALARDAVADAAAGRVVLHDGGHDGLDVLALPPAPPVDPDAPDPTTPWIELSTSGSTGAATLHAKTTGQLLGEIDAQVDAFGYPAGCRVLATVPGHHVYGLLFSVLLPLRRGGSFNDDAPLMHEAVAAHVDGVDVLVSVPAHLAALAEASPGTFDALPRVLSSGAPLPAHVADAWSTRFDQAITEVFGSTETGGIAWRQRRVDARWRPLPGVTVTEGDDGRLLLDAPWLAPDAPRPHAGDDRVEVHDDGTFTHHGRLDDVVKIASKRVSIGAVTAAIQAHPQVADAAVIAASPPGRDRVVLHAFVVGDADLADLRRHLRDRLDAVAIPRLHAVDALPRSATGKLPRAAVEALLPWNRRLVPITDSVEGDSATATFRLPAAHAVFAGHFPGRPVLPAVVQVEGLVVPSARRAWPELGALTGVSRARFRAAIGPDEDVEVTLQRSGSSVRFTISGAAGVAATGTATFA